MMRVLSANSLMASRIWIKTRRAPPMTTNLVWRCGYSSLSLRLGLFHACAGLVLATVSCFANEAAPNGRTRSGRCTCEGAAAVAEPSLTLPAQMSRLRNLPVPTSRSSTGARRFSAPTARYRRGRTSGSSRRASALSPVYGGASAC